jgi:hypothetical protein
MIETAVDIRRRAAKARELAKATHDRAASASLEDLAADLSERAREMEAEARDLATRAEINRQQAAEAKETARKIRAHVETLKKKKKLPG